VQGNHTDGGAGDGIDVGDDPYNGTAGVAANTGASTGNTISANVSSRNGRDGILADVTAQDSGNLFRRNTLDLNAGYDAHDLSTGSGTAGTANTWASNSCSRPRSAAPRESADGRIGGAGAG